MTSPDPAAGNQPNRGKQRFRAILIAALASLATLLAVSLSTASALADRPLPAGGAPGSPPQAVARDVAVTSIVRAGHKPPFATQGDAVTINVGVANRGSAAETFSVSLYDNTDLVEIGRQSVTLAAGASKTIAFSWDTSGATGGPPPPGPPAPGSIHNLTATATLAGDSDRSNNAMAFTPGFWIIAAAKPPTEIVFGESIPQAKRGGSLSRPNPTITTQAATSTKMFLSPVKGRLDGTLSNPGISTRIQQLTRILLNPSEAQFTWTLAGLNIATTVEPLSRVLPGWIEAPHTTYGGNRSLAMPSIATGPTPLTYIFLKPGPVKSAGRLANPLITTEAESPTEIVFGEGQASPQAEYGAGRSLADPTIGTRHQALPGMFISPTQARKSPALAQFTIATQGAPRQEIFVGGAAASAQPGQGLLDPFRNGEVAGKVHLQQRDSSLGAYVQIGEATHFVAADGSFRVEAAGGVRDIYIRAPGYLSAVIPAATINPGELLTIPELTLPFGDANGDGRIDILDLSIAAGNFGDTTRRLPAP